MADVQKRQTDGRMDETPKKQQQQQQQQQLLQDRTGEKRKKRKRTERKIKRRRALRFLFPSLPSSVERERARFFNSRDISWSFAC